jgi:N6-adenosine-specific RNA methylase IME4
MTKNNENENSLVIFTKAAQMLAEATTIQKAKELKLLALTAAEWAKRKGMGEEAVQHARAYALWAERRMGELLIETERAKGTAGKLIGPGRGKKNGATKRAPPFSDTAPTLADLGVSKKESAAAQNLAALPMNVFEEVVSGKKTRTAARREMRRKEIENKLAKPLPTGKYRVIYADPPWKYEDQLTESYGPTRFHYPAMTIAQLCDLPIANLADDDAVLFLWVTSPILPEAFPVIKAWGFTYKGSFIWDKVKHNMGHYNSVRHEFLLICTRGSCLPDSDTLVDSVQSIERSPKHSEKPEEFRRIIDMLYSKGRRLELFARKKAKGWDSWGNE